LAIAKPTSEIAAVLSAKYGLAYVTYFSGFVRYLCGDVLGARECADESITLASELGFMTVLAGAKVLRGWTLAHAREFDASVEVIRAGIVEFERTSGKIWHATLGAILLDVLIVAGRFAGAAPLADENIRFAEEFGERVTLAELWQAKGKICFAADHGRGEAEICFRRAVTIAKDQGARLFELRAAKNLAELLRDTGRRDEARTTLADIYNWFTEGFDTADLKDAKALLEELRGSR